MTYGVLSDKDGLGGSSGLYVLKLLIRLLLVSETCHRIEGSMRDGSRLPSTTRDIPVFHLGFDQHVPHELDSG